MEIILNAPTIYKVGNVQLVSGSNQVEENDELKSFLANPLVKLDIDMGMIKVIKEEKETTDKLQEFLISIGKEDFELPEDFEVVYTKKGELTADCKKAIEVLIVGE